MVFRKEIQVKYNVDVFIAGGGPAGIAAAWAAANDGRSVIIAENSASFGGMGTIGRVPMFCQFTDDISFLSDGFGRLVWQKCFDEDAVSPDDYTDHSKKRGSISIYGEKLKRIYDEIINGCGAKALLYTKVIDCDCKDGKIDYVILSGKSSIFAVKSKIYIDCTGDGVLAYYAGAEYEKGDLNGNMQPGTLCTLWSDIDWERAKKSGVHGLWPENDKFLDKAFEDNVFSTEDRHLSGIWRTGNTVGGGNAGHAVGVDGTDEESLTKATLEERKRIWEYEKYYRAYITGFENTSIIDSGEVLGIRETRRIIGRYVLNKDDYFNRAVFDDEIGRYNYQIDLHSNDADEYIKNDELFKKSTYKSGESYGIPYRCLTPKGYSNLLVAGRCISCDRYMQASVRVMPGCFITGQAAGMAASVAVQSGADTDKIDVNVLREKLKKIGAYL